MKDIVKDIKSGALPLREIPGFLLWLAGKSFWGWFSVVVAAFIILLAR